MGGTFPDNYLGKSRRKGLNRLEEGRRTPDTMNASLLSSTMDTRRLPIGIALAVIKFEAMDFSGNTEDKN